MSRKIKEYAGEPAAGREPRTAKSPEEEAQDKRSEMVDLLKSMSNALDALVYYATPSRGIAKPGVEKSIGSSLTQLGSVSEAKQVVKEQQVNWRDHIGTRFNAVADNPLEAFALGTEPYEIEVTDQGFKVVAVPSDKYKKHLNKTFTPPTEGAQPSRFWSTGMRELSQHLNPPAAPATDTADTGVRETQIKGSELKRIVAEELAQLLNEQGNPAYLSTPGNPVDRDGDGYPDHYDTRGGGVIMPGEEGNRYDASKAMRAQRRKYPGIPLPPRSVTPNEDNPLFVSDDPVEAGPAPGPITPQPDLGTAPAPPITDAAEVEDSSDLRVAVENMFRRQLAIDNEDPSWSAYLGSKQAQESGSKGAGAENERTKAYGLFQIMPNNWEPWRKEAEARYGLPEGSLADRKNAQNQYLVSRAKMQDYYDEFVQYGDDSPTGSVWGDLAAAWYTGGRRVRRAHKAKKAQNAGQDPSAADARALRWLNRMGKGLHSTKKNPKGEPYVGQYVDDVTRRMARAGGDPAVLASSSMLVPDHDAAIEEVPLNTDDIPLMVHVPGRGFVAVDDLEAEKEVADIQFQDNIIDTVAGGFMEPHDSETVKQRIALGMIDPADDAVADASPVQTVEPQPFGADVPPPSAYTPEPSEPVAWAGGADDDGDGIPNSIDADTATGGAPQMDADTQDALARAPSQSDSDRGLGAGGWCAEGEIQIQGQCVSIAQMLQGLSENKQNLKELVKEEIEQLIISKNLNLKGIK